MKVFSFIHILVYNFLFHLMKQSFIYSSEMFMKSYNLTRFWLTETMNERCYFALWFCCCIFVFNKFLFPSRLHCVIWSVNHTDLDPIFKNWHHFPSGMGLQLVVFGFFLPLKWPSFIKYVCYLLLLWSEREDKHAWSAVRHVKIVEAFCLHLFPPVWSAKPEYPQLERNSWLHHYMGAI